MSGFRMTAAVAAATLAASIMTAAGSAHAPARPDSGTSLLIRTDEQSRLTLTTTRVIVFKDGYAMLVKRGRAVADGAGRVFTDQVPDAAVLGCFWAARDDGSPLGMHARWVESERTEETPGPCLTMVELLRASVGKPLTLHTILQSQPTLSGRIVEVLELPPAPAGAPASLLARGRGEHRESTPSPRFITPLERAGGGYIVFMPDDGEKMVLPVSDVHRLSGEGVATSTTRQAKVTERTKRLTLDLGASAAGKETEIELMYFTPGIRWIPTYRLDLAATEGRDGVGRLALQAELLNELEDFSNAAVELVVGVPNFQFREVISPLSLEATLRNVLLEAAPGLMGARGNLSNALFSQRAGEWLERDDRSISVPGAIAPELGLTGEQDLYVYSLPRLALEKGSRATSPLWAAEVNVRHLYTFETRIRRDPRSGRRDESPDRRPPSLADSPTRLSPHQVWHQLEMFNEGDVPWTTGPALVMAGPRAGAVPGRSIPISQDLLRYTSPGGKTLLPVTAAMDMQAEVIEEEISRSPRRLLSYDYQEVMTRFTLKVTNRRKEPSRTRITAGAGGEASEASAGGAIRVSGFQAEDWSSYDWPQRINPHSDVTWELEIAPSETATVSFVVKYHLY